MPTRNKKTSIPPRVMSRTKAEQERYDRYLNERLFQNMEALMQEERERNRTAESSRPVPSVQELERERVKIVEDNWKRLGLRVLLGIKKKD